MSRFQLLRTPRGSCSLSCGQDAPRQGRPVADAGPESTIARGRRHATNIPWPPQDGELAGHQDGYYAVVITASTDGFRRRYAGRIA
jgi:hypothetical protein